DTAGFDDRAWMVPSVVGPPGVAPFTHLFPAATHIVEAQMMPVHLTRVRDDTFVADFGAVVAATPVVRIRAGRPGRSVTLTGGYELDPDRRVSRTRGVQDTDMAWHFDERAGAQRLRPFGYLAFRYLEVDGSGEQLSPDDIQIAARHASMPDEHAATFDSSDPTLNAVWNLARHSALYDSQEQFVDTPTREKGPFLGDSFDVSQATMAAFGERALTRQALRDFARSQARYWPDGRVNVVYPNGDNKRDIPDATQTFVEWIWQAFMTTGDREQLASLYPVARRISDYVARAIDDKTGLVTRLPGGGSDYLYGAVDWPPAMRYGYDMQTAARTMMNVLAVVDFRRVAAMAEALGRPDVERQREQTRADDVVAAIHERLTRPDGVLVDGLEANGKPSTHASQQANAWALAFGIVPPAQSKAVADYIVSLGNAMGVVYFRVLLDALHAAGRDDALVTSLTDSDRPGYAQILKEGATFTWESWNARAVGDSESHGWGSTVLAVLQDDILGVHTTAPGSRRVDVRVPKTALTRASGTVITERGPVAVSWTRAPSGAETLDVVVPVNATATVHLAAGRVADVSDDGRSVTGAPGVTVARAVGGEVELTLGSGHYRLSNTRSTPGSSSSGVGRLLELGAVALAFVAAAGVVITFVRRRRASM
ncbi:MAG: alpha-L-rhamnosidase, partial [Actinomycetota bacterium]|nr:alpha-L-rhamnosidase [Actinomycetota bacterium]